MEFFGECIQYIGCKSLKRASRFDNRRDDSIKTRLRQDNRSGRSRDIGRCRHCDSCLRLTKRGRIVEPVSAHGDHVPAILKRPGQPEFVFRINLSIDVGVLPLAAAIS